MAELRVHIGAFSNFYITFVAAPTPRITCLLPFPQLGSPRKLRQGALGLFGRTMIPVSPILPDGRGIAILMFPTFNRTNKIRAPRPNVMLFAT